MSIRVTYFITDAQVQREFSDELWVKVLQSGALKIIKPAEFEIPEMGFSDETPEPIVKTPEQVVAIFHGDYILECV